MFKGSYWIIIYLETFINLNHTVRISNRSNLGIHKHDKIIDFNMILRRPCQLTTALVRQQIQTKYLVVKIVDV